MEIMNDINIFLKMLEEERPFGYASFGDGEHMIITRHKTPRSSDEPYSDVLKSWLTTALTCQMEGYWVGLPCAVCQPRQHAFLSERVAPCQAATSAVVFTNRNLKQVKAELPPLLKKREVWWLGGEHHQTTSLPFHVTEHIKVPRKGAFAAWVSEDKISEYYNDIPQGSVVLLSCSFLATILASDIFMQRSDLTVIDMGAVWSPELGDRRWTRRIHRGELPPCKGCN